MQPALILLIQYGTVNKTSMTHKAQEMLFIKDVSVAISSDHPWRENSCRMQDKQVMKQMIFVMFSVTLEDILLSN